MSRRILIAVIVWFAGMSPTHAQTRLIQDEQDLINWYYAATYGTGIYTAGDRTVAILQVPLSRRLRESGDEQWGVRLTLPLSFGFYDYSFQSVIERGLPAHVSTFSLVPGVEFEKRIVPRWILKPYVSTGAGWELGGGESAWIYDAGLRTRFQLGEHRGAVFSLVNRLSLAGYYPSGGPNEPLSLFAIGVDAEVPTGGTLFGRPAVLSMLPVYYYYFKRLGFAEITDAENQLREEGELAISVLTKKPFTVFGIDVDRVGIAVRTNADFTGYRIFTTLPF